ncbi:MAG: cytochrome c3 family protein [Candidatus Zixiibacteriota bacterium]
MKCVWGFAIMLLAATAALSQDDRCVSCHGSQRPADQANAQIIDTTVLKSSVHAAVSCTECHAIDPDMPHRGNRTVYCARCHGKEAESFNKSPHVLGRKENIEKLPTCITCHGGHDVLAIKDPNSRTNHRNAVRICIGCHEDQQVTEQALKLPKPAVIKAYENSVHGRALMIEGKANAPACVDCHGSHSFLASDDPESPVYKTHIAATCGRCHHEIAQTYTESVHGQALSQGVMDSPTCTSCHGEHDIRPHADPESRVYKTSVSRTCSDCHASEKVVAKYGLKADRISTFQESFHGAAGALGDTRVANCSSCHGVHDIYPQDDSRSLINAANIDRTCGQCHEGLPQSFTKGAVHTSASVKESGGKFYVRQFYIWFISIIILAFIVYRVLEYKRRIKRVQ